MSINNVTAFENKKLRESLQLLEKQMEQYLKQIAEIEERVEEKDAIIETLTVDLKVAEGDKIKLTEKDDVINQLTAELDQAKLIEVKLNLANDTVRQLKSDLENSEARINEKNYIIHQLNYDLESAKSTDTEVETKNSQILELQEKQTECELECQNLQTIISRKTSEYGELNRDLIEVQAKVLAQNSLAIELEMRNQDVSTSLAQAQLKIEELEKVAAKSRDLLFTDSETDVIIDRMKATKMQNKSLKLENSQLTEDNEKLLDEYAAKEKQIVKANHEIEQIEAEKQDLTTKIKIIEDQLNAAKDELVSAEQKHEDALKYKEICEDQECTINDLTKQLDTVKAANENIERDLQAILRNRRRNEQEASELRASITKLQEVNQLQTNKITKLEERENELIEIKENLANTINGLEDSNFEKLKQITELKTKLNDLQQLEA